MRKNRFKLCSGLLVSGILLAQTSSCLLHAQVSIKERIEIRPTVFPWAKGGSIKSTDDLIFTAPRRAAFMIVPAYLFKLYAPPSPSSYLKVVTKDTSYRFPFVPALPCLYGSVSQDSNTCQQQHVEYWNYMQWCIGCPQGTGSPIDTFYTKIVNAGDTIGFTYIGSDTSYVSRILYNPDPSDTNWQISLQAPALDTCYNPAKSREGAIFMLHYADTSFAGFKIMASMDTVSILDTTNLTVIAIRHDSSETPLDGNTLLTLTLDSTRLGSFIDVSGNKVPSPLSNVKYSDARAGKIRFVASVIPDTTSYKNLRVQVDGSSGTGNRILTLIKLKLAFVNKTQRTLWPYFSTRSRGADRPGYKPARGFSIRLQDPLGNPIKNQAVKFVISFGVHTGGHDHTGHLDTVMVDSLKGTIWSQSHRGYSPFTSSKSDLSGIVLIDSLRASPFSGQFVLSAKLSADTTVVDSILLFVQVDSLVCLGTSPSWNLSGRTNDHTENHWATQKSLNSATGAITAFANLMKALRKGRSMTVGVNDMSLGKGGSFDIYGHWNSQKQHVYHRVGTSLDIDTLTVQGDVLKYRSKDSLSTSGKILTRIMHAFGGEPYPEPQVHFGFEGRN